MTFHYREASVNVPANVHKGLHIFHKNTCRHSQPPSFWYLYVQHVIWRFVNFCKSGITNCGSKRCLQIFLVFQKGDKSSHSLNGAKHTWYTWYTWYAHHREYNQLRSDNLRECLPLCPKNWHHHRHGLQA